MIYLIAQLLKLVPSSLSDLANVDDKWIFYPRSAALVFFFFIIIVVVVTFAISCAFHVPYLLLKTLDTFQMFMLCKSCTS